jgi:hypothetical protein
MHGDPINVHGIKQKIFIVWRPSREMKDDSDVHMPLFLTADLHLREQMNEQTFTQIRGRVPSGPSNAPQWHAA